MRFVMMYGCTSIDRVDEYAIVRQIFRHRMRHHIQRCFRHICMRVRHILKRPEFPFHTRHIDNERALRVRFHHQGFQFAVEDERGEGVDDVHFGEFDRGHFV